MNRLIIILMLISVQVYGQWTNQPVPNSFISFPSSFPSASTGYIVGYGNLILKTSNGGLNWIDMSFPGTANNHNTVWFLNENTGFLGSTTDSLMYTTNGGINWTNHFDCQSSDQRLFFINSNTGWVSSTKLFKTTNAGIN